MDTKMLNTNQAAELLGLEPATLAFWRAAPDRDPGLPFIRFNNRCVKYRLSDVLDFIDRHRVSRGGEAS